MGDEPRNVPSDDDGDDAQVSVESLGTERPHSRQVQRLWRPASMLATRLWTRLDARPILARAAGLALLAALVAATAATALGGVPRISWPFGAAARATPALSVPASRTPAGNVTPQPTPLPTVAWGKGWVRSGPSEAQRIVFATSMPAIGYTCGAPTLTSLVRPVPILVQISTDRGRTWQPAPTPAVGVECDLTVDPTDARDLVLATLPALINQPSPFADVTQPVTLYRSFDGGASWLPWPLPPAPDGAREFIALQWAWSGAVLFVAPYATDDGRWRRLAASVDGQAFGWVDQHGVFTALGSGDANIVALIGTSAALYVVVYSQPCASTCRKTVRSADGGQTWTRFAPTYQGDEITLLPGTADRALFGQVFDLSTAAQEAGGRYVQGRDGEPIWDSLPVLPANLVITRVWALPDGRIYAALVSFALDGQTSPGIYALTPDAGSWVFVASYPAGGPQSLAMSWDEHGHAVALWGAANSFLPDHLTGMEYYAL